MVTIFIKCGICDSELKGEFGDGDGESSEDNSLLQVQLNMVFLLQNIFELKASQLESYLKKWGDPGDWFKLCGRCEEEITEIRRIFGWLNEISRELERRKYEFQERLLQVENRTPGTAEVLNECQQALSHRRQGKRHSKPSESHPFEDGDRMASELALKVKVKDEEIDCDSNGDWEPGIFHEGNEKSCSDEFEDGDNQQDQDGYLAHSYSQSAKSVSEFEAKDVDVNSRIEDTPSRPHPRRCRRKGCRCPNSRKRDRPKKFPKLLSCPILHCSTRFTLGSFIEFSEHVQKCIATTTTTPSALSCSMCKVWSCPSKRIREFLEHAAFCREDHKSGVSGVVVVPWRHALMKCTLCEDDLKYKYLTLPDYAIHINKYHQHRYSCTQCPYRGQKGHTISIQHWNLHHKDLLDATPISDRYNHHDTIPPLPEIPWWCPASECLQKFSNEASRDEHLNNCCEFNDQLPERSEKCTFCGRDYFSNEELLMHRVSIHGYRHPKDSHCKECNIFFENSAKLQAHQRWDHNVNLYKCNDCDMEFCDRNTLRRHVKREHGLPEKPKEFTCHVCAKSYTHEHHLRHHINKVHEGKVKRKCAHCELEFNDNMALRLHMTATHPEIEEESHPCPKEGCLEVFRTSVGLKMHLTGFHSKFARIFTCSVCQHKFYREANYQKHVKAGCKLSSSSPWKAKARSVLRSKPEVVRKKRNIYKGQGHLRSLRVQCDLCAKTFHDNAALRRHKAEVHGLGEYPCEGEGCSRIFSSRQLMEIHKKVVHDKVREFTCSFCGRRLASSWLLRHHEDAMHRNKDSKPFKCHLCENKTFATNTYLIYHYKHTHKIPKGKVSLAEKVAE